VKSESPAETATSATRPGQGSHPADRRPSPHKRISDDFRNGSITAVGVITGFALTFLTGWAASPVAWTMTDLIVLAPLLVGTVCQIRALAMLLHPDSLILSHYRRATRYFLVGVILTALGLGVALTADIVPLLLPIFRWG